MKLQQVKVEEESLTINMFQQGVHHVRNEIVLGAREYLSQRLDLEQEDIVKQIKIFLAEKTAAQMINSTRKVVKSLFGSDCITEFYDEVLGHFSS